MWQQPGCCEGRGVEHAARRDTRRLPTVKGSIAPGICKLDPFFGDNVAERALTLKRAACHRGGFHALVGRRAARCLMS
eukprot:3386001-Prymnesium_polylepis.1